MAEIYYMYNVLQTQKAVSTLPFGFAEQSKRD